MGKNHRCFAVEQKIRIGQCVFFRCGENYFVSIDSFFVLESSESEVFIDSDSIFSSIMRFGFS